MLWEVSACPGGGWVMAAPFSPEPGPVRRAGGDSLVLWAERTGRRRAGLPGRGGLRFMFYGRVSTQDWQDPVTSRARQREQAGVLVAGHGTVVAEFFDCGTAGSCRGHGGPGPLPWWRRWPIRTGDVIVQIIRICAPWSALSGGWKQRQITKATRAGTRAFARQRQGLRRSRLH